MAQQTKRKTSGNRSGSSASRKATSKNTPKPMDMAIKNELLLIALFAIGIVLVLCNFGLMGALGTVVKSMMFGLFGLTAYVVPVFFFVMIAFGMINTGNMVAVRKIIAAVFLYLIVSMICDFAVKYPLNTNVYSIKDIYLHGSTNYNGGGVLGGSLAYLSNKALGIVGSVFLMLVLAIIAVIVITDKSLVNGVKKGGRKVYDKSREEAKYRKEQAALRRERIEDNRRRKEEAKKLRMEEEENEKILRMDKKVSGVMLNTELTKEPENTEKNRDDIHEISVDGFDEQFVDQRGSDSEPLHDDYDSYDYEESYDDVVNDNIKEISSNVVTVQDITEEKFEDIFVKDIPESVSGYEEISSVSASDYSPKEDKIQKLEAGATDYQRRLPEMPEAAGNSQSVPKPKKSKEYKFPPINLLNKGKSDASGGDSRRELDETAKRLQETLASFGVKVTMQGYSQGPTVTRFEIQPDQGVKVSKIKGLEDDIKLNLASTDIRIEAPIPGKNAVGIEVPNKTNSAVAFRDLIESKEFHDFKSNLAFAVGKDIGGRTVVSDIAKMPHMLIAGSTGSGKSVCINAIIMSILYKAHPRDVKLIMVDPKVVELSVYNGIPHLLIPVVTDPKKASAALQWAVAEMNDRYHKFENFGVRNLQGYNETCESMQNSGDPEAPEKLPQIVIIVDELADLMMVSAAEVEESICRIAQLARAAGIHLIIATQRPSVDVITGLIKANMPSRVAFAVSSSVDSRTVLDMGGAEKLLGHGDMLFYPQGYSKPARIQGAFVSDKEVSDVVEYLKNQSLGNEYDSAVQEKISSMGTSSCMDGSGNVASGSDRDEYFVEAARFIIDKDKASIGMLQRVFKIGFNRAARIMDQLCEAGVVGEEEGTKPRKILMSSEQFDEYVDEYL